MESIRSPPGVSGLYQDVWGSVTYSPGSEIVGLHVSNMPNKMLWHTKHIAYIPMVQKSSVFTSQTCQIKLMGVGHCFVWCYGYSIYISYITYPIIPTQTTQTFVIKSPSLYRLVTVKQSHGGRFLSSYHLALLWGPSVSWQFSSVKQNLSSQSPLITL